MDVPEKAAPEIGIIPGQPIPVASEHSPVMSTSRTGTPVTLKLVSLDDSDSDDEDSKPVKLSRAKMLFNKAALTVLTGVIDKRIKQDQPENQVKEIRRESTSDVMRTGRSQRSHSLIAASPIVTPRPKKGMSLASIVGVVTFRKVYMSRLQAHAEKQVAEKKPHHAPSMDHIDEEGVEDAALLPATPRFCATLSPEAQIAMLKGYEDKLIKDLKSSFPEEEGQLVKVKAPYGKKVKINDKGIVKKSDEALPNVGTNKDLELRRLTGNFETAMNILDQIKSSRGEKVLSSHRQQRTYLPPVKRYNNWARHWSRQFNADSGSR